MLCSFHCNTALQLESKHFDNVDCNVCTNRLTLEFVDLVKVKEANSYSTYYELLICRHSGMAHVTERSHSGVTLDDGTAMVQVTSARRTLASSP